MQTEIKALRLLFEPGSAGKGEHAAFEELNRFIAEATGSAPETAAPNAKPEHGVLDIFINGSAENKSDTGLRGRDCRITVTPRGVYLVGSGKTEYSILNAAYKLLHELFGLEFFAADCYTFQRRDLSAANTLATREYHFDITYQAFSAGEARTDDDIIPFARMGMLPYGNGCLSLDSDSDGRRNYSKHHLFGNSDMWCESYFRVLPPTELFEAHPDWYYVRDGKPNQLCITNEELIAEYATRFYEKCIKNDTAKYYIIGNEDTTLSCTCDKCRAVYDKYNEGGALVLFMNKVDEYIREHLSPVRTDYVLVGLAYNGLSEPPIRFANKEKLCRDINGKHYFYDEWEQDENGVPVPSIRCNKNCCIMYAPIKACTYHAYNDPHCHINRSDRSIDYDFVYNNNSQLDEECVGYRTVCDENGAAEKKAFYCYHSIYDQMRGWAAVSGSDFQVYLYDCPYYNYSLINDTVSCMQENYRFLRDIGVSYVYTQGNCVEHTNGSGTPFYPYKFYLRSLLAEKAEADVKAATERFFEAYYGKQAKAVLEYFNETIAVYRSEKTIAYRRSKFVDSRYVGVYDQCETCFGGLHINNGDVWTDELTKRLYGMINTAYEASDGVYRQRIKMLEVCMRYLRYSFGYINLDAEQFKKDCADIGLYNLSIFDKPVAEMGDTIDKIKER